MLPIHIIPWYDLDQNESTLSWYRVGKRLFFIIILPDILNEVLELGWSRNLHYKNIPIGYTCICTVESKYLNHIHIG